MIMLDQIFYTDKEDKLFLSGDALLEQTDWEFSNAVINRIGTDSVREMSFAGDRRTRFVYFRTETGLFSFSWEKKTGVIVFSEQIQFERNRQKAWKFVIGWQPE
jgi:hypothetical protein